VSLRERLEAVNVAEPGLARRTAPRGDRAYQDLKSHLHKVLLERIDLEAMESLTPERLRDELRMLVETLLDEENVVVNELERRSLVRDIQFEMLGLGPLELLLATTRFPTSWSTTRSRCTWSGVAGSN
jgi:pilus assembly protein CpaF